MPNDLFEGPKQKDMERALAKAMRYLTGIATSDPLRALAILDKTKPCVKDKQDNDDQTGQTGL